MSESMFKPGEFVYWPSESSSVFQLSRCDNSLNKYYPLSINLEFKDGSKTVCYFTEDGKAYLTDEFPSIFHANHMNKFALELLYGIELESPPDDNSFVKELQNVLHKKGIIDLL